MATKQNDGHGDAHAKGVAAMKVCATLLAPAHLELWRRVWDKWTQSLLCPGRPRSADLVRQAVLRGLQEIDRELD